MSNFKLFLIKKQDKLILCIGIILISLISFGLGRLSVGNKSKIIIQEPEIIETQFQVQEKGIINKTLVGSRNSDKYHLPDCSWADRIKKENQIWFSTAEEAEKIGYKPASCILRK